MDDVIEVLNHHRIPKSYLILGLSGWSSEIGRASSPGILRRLFGFPGICSPSLIFLVVGSIGLGNLGQSRRLDIENRARGKEAKLGGILSKFLGFSE